MAKYALILEYDGSSFHGWQSQNGVATVQKSLELALSKFANEPISTITAGRTDTGVHALNQVVHFCSDVKRSLVSWLTGVNALMPKTIRIKQIHEVDDYFDARFSAITRTYHYYLLIRPYNSAHLQNHIGWYYRELNLAAMQNAADLLIGRHDFSSFRASQCQANSPVRDMKTIQINRQGNVIRFSLTANAFLHHMVRNIVGALVYVGDGRMSLEQFNQVFLQCNRQFAPPTFMANGLYLADVDYNGQLSSGFDESLWLYNI